MGARDVRRLTVQEYVALDRDSEERWEYANGEAWATRGASPEHGIVARNVTVSLGNALRDRPCIPFPDGQKIATPRTRAYHYPDASVVCGDLRCDDTDDRAITNPTLLVEILSPTTADYDRGGKLAHYRTLDSLQEYVIVSWETKLVEHHRRVGAEQWLVTLVREGGVELASIGATLVLDELWRDLDRLRA
jgi:Uma2 family endonuclease